MDRTEMQEELEMLFVTPEYPMELQKDQDFPFNEQCF